jgi:hypothetical protein
MWYSSSDERDRRETLQKEVIEKVELEDRGSNYRYLNEEYGTNAMWA